MNNTSNDHDVRVLAAQRVDALAAAIATRDGPSSAAQWLGDIAYDCAEDITLARAITGETRS